MRHLSRMSDCSCQHHPVQIRCEERGDELCAHRPRGFVPEQERGHTIGGTRLSASRSCLSCLGRLLELFQDFTYLEIVALAVNLCRYQSARMGPQFPYYRTTPYISPFSLPPLSPTFYFYLCVHAPRQSSALRKGCKAAIK